ncbi:MAG: tetratricopeptide repeat protein [Candidatus Anstonellaceae archaeon]
MNNTNKAVIIYNEGVKAYKEKRYNEAALKFLEVLKIDKKDPQLKIALASSYNNYGVWLYKEKRYKEAFSFFKKAAEIEPTNPKYKENLEIAKQKMEKIKLQNLTDQAYAFFQDKKYEKALKKLLDAKKIDKENVSITKAIAACYNAIGIKYYLKKEFKKALNYFELAKQTYSQNYKYLDNIKTVQQIITTKNFANY